MIFTRDELVWINNALNEVTTGGPAIGEVTFVSAVTLTRFAPYCEG